MPGVRGKAAGRFALRHNYSDLITIFNDLFAEAEATCLRRGGDEPVYLPRRHERELSEVVFARGYFASALHEVAHWCIAGTARRQQVDYGYWYVPDGRDATQQAAFTQVEVAPQALEWVFSVAAGCPFHFSADNLGDDGGVEVGAEFAAFQQRVHARARSLALHGLTGRAQLFANALAHFYQTRGRWRDPDSYQDPREAEATV